MAERRITTFEILKKAGCFKKGEFISKAGNTINFYSDIRQLCSFPELKHEIIKQLIELTNEIEYDVIVGVPSGGTLLAAPFAYSEAKPYLEMPTNTDIRGLNALVIEDVISTGTSLFPVIKQIEESGGVIPKIIVAVDRRIEKGNFQNIPVVSLVTLEEIMQLL